MKAVFSSEDNQFQCGCFRMSCFFGSLLMSFRASLKGLNGLDFSLLSIYSDKKCALHDLLAGCKCTEISGLNDLREFENADRGHSCSDNEGIPIDTHSLSLLASNCHGLYMTVICLFFTFLESSRYLVFNFHFNSVRP